MSMLPALVLAAAALTGRWGGDHIRLELTESGGTVEYDCAHGTVDGAIRPGADGRFAVAGTLAREHPGPIRRDEEARPGAPVRYEGRVVGDDLELTVRTAAEGGEVVGTYTLTRGAQGRVFKCR